jgi:hypothetical protein
MSIITVGVRLPVFPLPPFWKQSVQTSDSAPNAGIAQAARQYRLPRFGEP